MMVPSFQREAFVGKLIGYARVSTDEQVLLALFVQTLISNPDEGERG